MTLFVIVGPSGVGKNVLVNEILKKRPEIKRSVSTTTREPRHGEINHKDYHFVTKEEFMKMVTNGEMLEWFEYCKNLYGTEKNSLEVAKDVIKIIDVKGASAYRKKGVKGIYIFIKADLDILRKRLENRGDKDIDLRLKTALREFEDMPKYDYIIENNKELEVGVNELLKIIDKHLE